MDPYFVNGGRKGRWELYVTSVMAKKTLLRPEAKGLRPEARGWRQEAGGRRPEAGSRRQEAGSQRLKAGAEAVYRRPKLRGQDFYCPNPFAKKQRNLHILFEFATETSNR